MVFNFQKTLLNEAFAPFALSEEKRIFSSLASLGSNQSLNFYKVEPCPPKNELGAFRIITWEA